MKYSINRFCQYMASLDNGYLQFNITHDPGTFLTNRCGPDQQSGTISIDELKYIDSLDWEGGSKENDPNPPMVFHVHATCPTNLRFGFCHGQLPNTNPLGKKGIDICKDRLSVPANACKFHFNGAPRLSGLPKA
jgi:hypothetical protein